MVRFIPAGAGNTINVVAGAGFETVHPRGCGEHDARSSAPLPSLRFIPAGAGNTWSISAEPAAPDGSSPRVRGTPDRVTGCHYRGRFIPAGAGNTMYRWISKALATVHPRGCGEHLTKDGPVEAVYGSSPRVRGTRRVKGGDSPGQRFIPAGAGNTAVRARRRCWRAVHPRGCGEHPAAGARPAVFTGSSPRVRGTLALQGRDVAGVRFIPAGAGNTPPPFNQSTAKYGSSPRVRGTHG